MPAAEPTPAPVVEPTAPVAPVTKPPGKTKAEVIDEGGNVIRTYTLEVHGEDFANLAAQFAGKRSLSVR